MPEPTIEEVQMLLKLNKLFAGDFGHYYNIKQLAEISGGKLAIEYYEKQNNYGGPKNA